MGDMGITSWDDYDDLVRTGRGRRALSSLKEVEALHAEAARIRQAVREGLLPAVSLERVDAIERSLDERADRAAWALDRAEGWRP